MQTSMNVFAKLYSAMLSASESRMNDDRGEVSSYLIFVALLVVAVGVLAAGFTTLFTNLMSSLCTAAGTSC